MKRIFISGSTAYDTRMLVEKTFSDYIWETSWDASFNASMTSNIYEKNHGGAGANIAYNLALLNESPVLLTAVWQDYSFDGIMQSKVHLDYIHRDTKLHSANSVIVSDTYDNRFTFFHPGAMAHASESRVEYIREDIGIAIISPNHIPTMLEHAKDVQFKSAKIIADPSQQISQMTKQELLELFSYCKYFIANQYEYNEVLEKLAESHEDFVSRFESVIITYNEKGTKVYTGSDVEHVYAIDVEDIVDTTGAGDALRAGVLFALIEWHSLVNGVQLWTLMASYCIVAPGSQYHHFTLDGLMEDMKLWYGVEIDLYKRRDY